MGAFITRQPNGLLCRFSTVVDCMTDYNMTQEEFNSIKEEMRKEESNETD